MSGLDDLIKGVAGGKALAAAGFGGALLVLMNRPAFADQTTDITIARGTDWAAFSVSSEVCAEAS